MKWSDRSEMSPPLQVCGDWRLEREIGHGAYGVVYLAVAPDGEPAAVKVCQRDAVGPERYSRELRGELQEWMDCWSSRHKSIYELARRERYGDSRDGLSDEQWCVHERNNWGRKEQ